MVAGAHQSFQFFNTWFHENNRPSSKFLYWILHCFISIAKLLKKQSIRPKVILPTRATLTRNNRSQMFFKVSVLNNFATFIGKHLCWSLFKVKLQAPWLETLLKRDPTQAFFLEYFLWLLLLNTFYVGSEVMELFRENRKQLKPITSSS